MLCLTLSPETYGITTPAYYSLIYGAEYQDIPGVVDHDVPCSVCRAAQSTTIMLPGTHSCPKGWLTQYKGHLVTGRPVHKAASEFVCLDVQPEAILGSHKNLDGYLLYYTFTQCGTLPCPPYKHMSLTLCVVCSK
ncbi:hypothetical protein ACOMHN_022613 [Nucella lapillus]